ncbi:phosphoesterase [Roseimaritima sediminicola]|uniref:phosphoesterase n=1 Tax=Roseimaritima sediminicola TaxID=2662066 RepID=UPI0012983E54|nr:phosphoesterase [Roseimaritima sediminicola]
MPRTEEHILVIPAATIERLGAFEGFQSDVQRYLPAILASDELSFRPRSQMEQDPSFKQLIPYVVLQYEDRQRGTQVFAYTRGSGQGESRLHARRSIGIGGHISEEDAAGGSDPYRTGMHRELAEEVRLDSAFEESCVGLIYDPSNEVGTVHLGIVHRLILETPAVVANEEDICDTGFVGVEQLRGQRERLETWSQLCLDHLF